MRRASVAGARASGALLSDKIEWQAPAFYAKHGYVAEVARTDNYIGAFYLSLMKKSLSDGAN
jgi:glycine cleavage system aminomethyltransferase T